MNQKFLTHLSRAGLLVGVANFSFFVLTQLFFLISDAIDLVLFLPMVLLVAVISIYFLFLKMIRTKYPHPKKLALFLTLMSLPLLIAFPFGRLNLNDIQAFIMVQIIFFPLGLAVIGGQGLLLWSFRNKKG